MADQNLQLGSSTADTDREILNYDQLAEILSYLSAKNLSRLHLVSKSLQNMITSDPFFHLMQSYHNSGAAAIFVDSYCHLQLFPLDPDAGVPRASLDILSANDARILCSAGGLIFYRKKDSIFYSICAYNPVRRECCVIPIPQDGGIALYSSLAVEFTNDGDGVTHDYKLVYLTPDQVWSSLCRCRVYDSAAQVWTRDEMIHHGGRNLKFHNPVVHQGVVFWASDCFRYTTVDPYVMSYEIATGAIEFLAMPDDGTTVESNDNISVAIWEESCLCLVHYSRRPGTFTVWRWSADHSWVKLNELVYSEKPEAVGTMLVCNGGKEKGMVLVFSVEDKAYVYSFRQRDLTRLATSAGSNFPTFIPYSNTLRPAC